MSKTEKMPPAEITLEYDEGREARRDGVGVEDNPYPHGQGLNNQRFRWYVGWYDREMAERFPRT